MKAPWKRIHDGMFPGDFCCLRAASGRCYEHDPKNYPLWQRLYYVILELFGIAER